MKDVGCEPTAVQYLLGFVGNKGARYIGLRRDFIPLLSSKENIPHRVIEVECCLDLHKAPVRLAEEFHGLTKP